MRPAFLLLVTLTLVGCAAGLSISKGFVGGASASGWQDYAWLKTSDGGVNPQIEAVHSLIRSEIDETLQAKGYRKVAESEADFLVSHSIFAHWEMDQMSDRELEAIAEQSIMTGEQVSDLEYVPHEHGEGMLNVILSLPDGTTAWSGRLETPLDYRGQGARKIPRAITELLGDFPER